MMQPREGIWQRAKRAFGLVFPGSTGRSSSAIGAGYGGGIRWMGAMPGTQTDYAREVGDPMLNSAVSICLHWIGDQFSEPELEVYSVRPDGSRAIRKNHELVRLVERPNEFYDGQALWKATVFSYDVTGNAFWLIVRDQVDRPVQLWHIPAHQIRPRWDKADSFIDWYEYIADGKSYRLERRDVIHFFDAIDHRSRLGISRLFPALRSVAADNEIQTYYHAILKNMGICGVMIVPGQNEYITEDQADQLRNMWSSQFTGDNRGRPLVSSGPLKVEKMAITPEEMALDRIGTAPEHRIAASLRLPPQVVGLQSGEDNKTYANYDMAERAAYADCIIPKQSRFALTLTHQLLPEWQTNRDLEVGWNYERVSCLREDQDLAAARCRADFTAGIITRAEARAARGYTVDANDHVYVLIPVVNADDTAEEIEERQSSAKVDAAKPKSDSGQDGDPN